MADSNLMRLLKSYFNMEISHKILKTKRMANRFKRLTTKRIYIGKGDLKHTSSKTIITFYVYNTQKMFLSRAHFLTKKALFYPKKGLVRYKNEDINKNIIITYNRPLNLKEFLALPEHFYDLYLNLIALTVDINNLGLSNLDLQRNILIKMVNLSLITEDEKNETLINLYNNIFFINTNTTTGFYTLIEDLQRYYLRTFRKYKYLLGFHKMKFSKPFISRLTTLVQNIYNKKVEFNIVNLKKMHFNSDIYTQAVALKLRSRENSLYRVLKSSLRKVKLPEINRVSEKIHYINKDKLLVNLIRNDNVSSMFSADNPKSDQLNNLILKFYPTSDNLYVENKGFKGRNVSLRTYVLKSLKHLKLRGIRVEAKGRITRRFTASRSVFKMK